MAKARRSFPAFFINPFSIFMNALYPDVALFFFSDAHFHTERLVLFLMAFRKKDDGASPPSSSVHILYDVKVLILGDSDTETVVQT
ncbi:hypothetical protein [Mesobacillus foraminis]|uniref:hypothetical protein n=1 Tax=Mesobacillus foraminis TaxID=279826 RepID=UPI0013CE53C5|nr:hypothetical protein [Mesobacillus foraminis]